MGVPRLSVCADAQKVDRAKLAQTEFSIIEFDPETFRVLLDYLHTGSCPLTCVSIPGNFQLIRGRPQIMSMSYNVTSFVDNP